MFSSETYMEMFRELVKIHSEPGPFNKPWCNVPMAKFHKLQGITINSGCYRIGLFFNKAKFHKLQGITINSGLIPKLCKNCYCPFKLKFRELQSTQVWTFFW
jgi:hypothetical protein